MRTRSIASGDGKRLRVGSWDAAPGAGSRGFCAIFDGQTEFIEKYAEVTDELAARGFSGAILDWRGQGGSERLIADPLKAHVRDFTEYDGDLSAFMDQIVQPEIARPPVALAHSMGAHILLRALKRNPKSFSGAVMTAPMLRTATRGYPAWLVRAICSAHARVGLANGWVWGMQERDPLRVPFDENLVTSDCERFTRTRTILGEHPDTRLAGPTWCWLEAAYRSMAELEAPGFAAAITTPCLIFGAGRDRIVETAAVRDFARRLPHGRYVEMPEAEHEILMENDSIRGKFWTEFDAFVGQVL
ncbi:MAG TPA: alpha/beta hydrolase [Rhizomicrobium sp.]|nr:alpha/beta hydrolase [Rhizomicrobium sp.]